MSRSSWGEDGAYRQEHGHLRSVIRSGAVKALRANLTLYRNVKELCDISVLAGVSLKYDTHHQESEWMICPHALRRELFWDIHKPAHDGASQAIRCLKPRWYWPRLTCGV